MSSLGTASHARFSALREAATRAPAQFRPATDGGDRISKYFGMNTLGWDELKKRLPKPVFKTLLSTVHTGKKLDPKIAAPVAAAIQEWAVARGVTHFCHWFQPQTGSTAEKHDAFLSFDKNNRVIEKLSASQLIQSEPDASSFPSGGMRTTFEARGYTAWDPSSPVFIVETGSSKTLCIPSVFISYHGDALDEKTALLRSTEVLSQKACELLGMIGLKGVKRVVPTLGAEQEYFLVDRALFSLRPDLMMTGRTLVGGQPPKGQQLEDHYFGSIPARVLAFMSEMEQELYKLGVPVKTRHNEVAPSQFESAPIFEEANVATDHNQIVMEVLRKVAARHSFSVILHEKPFAGVNGSGKHCNWSLMVTASGSKLDGSNLLDPGKTPRENLQFLLILAGILKGVHKHAGLLRAGIASSGNDHRLGANEAPPAIISVFLGEMLNRILNEVESASAQAKNTEAAVIKLGVSKIPEVMRDNTDRNRTSPFAFTGNKFEFRAVGASASTAFPVTLVNAAVADGFTSLIEAIRAKAGKNKGPKLDAIVLDVIRDTIRESKSIRFEGNNYSDEWVREAERRGLPNLRKTPEALAQLISPSSKKMLIGLGIFSEGELGSRYHVRLERYVKNLLIEVDTLRTMMDTMILPACYGYHGMLAQAVASSRTAGIQNPPQLESLNRITKLMSSLASAKSKLDGALHKAESSTSEEDKARGIAESVVPAMAELRALSDELEASVSDECWPFPKYREMLFLN